MRRFVALATGIGFLAGVLAGAVPVPRTKKALTFLDLQAKANQKLKDPLHGGTAGNDLSTLPQGERNFGGAKFKIGDGMIQLAGKDYRAKPDKVEGIPVGQKFAKLYILHAMGFGYQTPENTVVAQYVIHYQDKTKETVDILFGKDVRDWWYYQDTQNVSRSRVAWTGTNAASKNAKAKIRLYLTTWKNPHPKKKVTSIDFISTRTTLAAPFCVALTVEGN
jgi:hypothetical protein